MPWTIGMVVLFLGPSCFVHQQTSSLDLRRHVGEVGHDHLVVSDRLSEGLALVGVLERRLVRALGDAQRLGGDADAAVVEGVHGDGEPVADAFDGVFNRHFAVVEHERARV